MATNKCVSRRTNMLTKELKLDLFIMNKNEIRQFTNNEPDFVATVNMYISGCNKFIFMFDNFREEALQTLLNHFLPRGISRPDWWPSTDSKWWAQLGFPTHKGDPPFELDASKLSKVWKVAVLVGIIQDHSPRVICNALRLDEKMKAVTSEKEKFVLSAALIILDRTFSSESNEDAGSTTVTCKEHVVLALAAPPKEKPLVITWGSTSNQSYSQAPLADVNRPDDVAELRNISGRSRKRKRAKTVEKEPFPIAAAIHAIPISCQAPPSHVDQPDDVADQKSISDSDKSSSEFHNTAENAAEEIVGVPDEPTLIPGDAPGNNNEFSEWGSIAKPAEEMDIQRKMKGTDKGESSNSTAPNNGIPPFGIDE